MNVSKEADVAFMSALEAEQPARFANLEQNIRRDLPTGSVRMSESQALTNFTLGLPTGQYRFEVVAGAPESSPELEALKETRRKQGYLNGADARRYHALCWGEESATRAFDLSDDEYVASFGPKIDQEKFRTDPTQPQKPSAEPNETLKAMNRRIRLARNARQRQKSENVAVFNRN